MKFSNTRYLKSYPRQESYFQDHLSLFYYLKEIRVQRSGKQKDNDTWHGFPWQLSETRTDAGRG